jgi:hypothetical protein
MRQGCNPLEDICHDAIATHSMELKGLSGAALQPLRDVFFEQGARTMQADFDVFFAQIETLRHLRRTHLFDRAQHKYRPETWRKRFNGLFQNIAEFTGL